MQREVKLWAAYLVSVAKGAKIDSRKYYGDLPVNS